MSEHKFNDTIRHIQLAFAGKRRVGGEPMAMHSIRVGSKLSQYGCDEPTVIAGFLHDCDEDTWLKVEIIKNIYGEVVSRYVEAVSYLRSLGDTTAGENELFVRVRLLAEANMHAPLIIKLVDAADNLVTCEHLKDGTQQALLERAERWLWLGSQHVPDHRGTADLEYALTWEKKRRRECR